MLALANAGFGSSRSTISPPAPPSPSQHAFSAITEVIGIRNVQLVPPDSFEPSPAERLIARRLGFFLSYISRRSALPPNPHTSLDTRFRRLRSLRAQGEGARRERRTQDAWPCRIAPTPSVASKKTCGPSRSTILAHTSSHRKTFPVDQVGKRAILLIGNHSGMGLSWDNIILDFLLYDLLRTAFGDAHRAIDNKASSLRRSPLPLPQHRCSLWHQGLVAPHRMRCRNVRQSRSSRPGASHRHPLAGRRCRHRERSSQEIPVATFFQFISAHGSHVRRARRTRQYCQRRIPQSLEHQPAVGERPWPEAGISLRPDRWRCAAGPAYPQPTSRRDRAKLTYVLHPPIDFQGSTAKTYSELRAEAEAFRQACQTRLHAEVRTHHRPYNDCAARRGPRPVQDPSAASMARAVSEDCRRTTLVGGSVQIASRLPGHRAR